MSDILTGFNMQGNDPIDDRIVSKSNLETLEQYLNRVPVQKRYYGLTFFALDKNNELRKYTFQTSLIEPTIDDNEEEIERIDKELQEHVSNKAIHKTSEEIRSEIVDADIPDTIARVQWTLDQINTAVINLIGGASDEYNTLKRIQTKIEELRAKIYGDDGGEVLKTLEQALKFLNQYKDFIVDIPDNFVSKQDIVDNLTTDDPTKVLSAKQGKVLSDTLTNYFESAMQSIRTETDRAINAENRIETKLDKEIDRSTKEDQRIDSKLDSEINRSTTEDDRLDKKIDAETTRATTVESNLNTKIETETDRAESEESRIETKLDNEIARSTNKDTEHDNRLTALEGDTHEQNTDLGTTNSTFQLKYNTGNKIKHESDAISVRNAADTDYVNFIAKNATFKGDLLVEGQSFVTEAETVEIKDNLLLLNKGEVGAGVTKGIAGLEIDRGTEPNYQIIFDESDNRFKAGEIGDIQCLALRDGDDNMTGGMFTSWDSTTKRLKTTNIVPSDQKISFGDNGDIELKYSLSKMGEVLPPTTPVLNIGRKGSNYPHIEFGLSSNHAVIYTDASNGIYLQNQVLGRTFKRASDNSEVLYHADIINDLTTGGTNKVLSAEQGKLLQNSITSIQGSYLPLSGGTMTGSIIFPNRKGIFGRLTDGTGNIKIAVVNANNNVEIGNSNTPLMLVSNSTDLTHYRDNNTYKIWDKFNLSDPVTYITNAYNHATLKNKDGQYFTYIKAGTNGLLPHSKATLVSGGSGSLGVSDQSFNAAYINNLHTNKVTFGDAGSFIDNQSGDSSHIGIGFYTSQNAACPVYVGSLCVSDSYANSAPNIPTNGIYSSGAIKSAAGFTSNSRQTSLNLAKTGNDVLYISSFVNGATGSPGSDFETGRTINDGMFLTYFWQNDHAFQLAADIDGAGIAYRHYIPSTGNSTAGWKFLADTDWVVSKINSSTSNFLKKTGDTATGQIILDSNGIAFKANIWTNDLTPNRNYSGYLQVLDAYDASSAGGPTNYGTVLQINSRIDHWANQLWFGNNDNMYLRRMNYGSTTYGEWNRLLTNKDVNILPASYKNDPNSLPINQIFYAETQGVTGTPTDNGLLFSVQGNDEGIQLWAGANRTELYYRTKWASFGRWFKLATTSDLNSYLTKTEASTLYYPYNGRGYLSITSTGKPVMSNNQGYAVKDKDGNEREVLWMGTNNALYLGNTSQYTLNQLDLRCTTLTHNGNPIATQFWSNNTFAKTSHTHTVNQLSNLGTNWSTALTAAVYTRPLSINGTNYNCYAPGGSSSITLYAPTTAGTSGQILQSTGGVPTWVDASSAVGNFVSKSGDTMTGALTMNSRRHNIVVDVVGGAGNSWDEGAGALSIQVPSDSGQTPLILARRSSAAINTTTLSERLLDMALLDTGTIFKVGMSGVDALQLEVTSFTNKVGIGKLFGKQIATTDQIPSIPSISISNSGTGNAVTSITANGHTLTVTKGATYLTSHQTIYNLTFQAGTFSAKTFDPNGAAATVNIPTKTSHITNDSGFITSSALSGYATQSWANGQFAPLKNYFVTSNYASIATTGNEMCIGSLTSGNSIINVNYRNGTGTTSPSTWYWRAGSSSSWANAYWGNLYMNNNLVATQTWSNSQYPLKTGTGASGTWDINISGNASTASTASKLGSTTIGGSAKPIYLSSGTPTACSATVGSATVPVYMNAGTITQCSTTLGVSITGNAATATNATQLGGTAASSYVKANDNISRLTNDSGYTTQEWVNGQGFLTLDSLLDKFVPTTGGYIRNSDQVLLRLQRTGVSTGTRRTIEMYFDDSNTDGTSTTPRGSIGYDSEAGMFLYSVASGKFLAIENTGKPFYGTSGNRYYLLGSNTQYHNSDGYQRIGDIMIQWGYFTVQGNSTRAVNFPVSFTNTVWSVTGSWDNTTTGNQENWGFTDYTSSGFTIINGDGSSRVFHYIAIGPFTRS